MRLVLALIQPTKLKAVQEALNKIGVARMIRVVTGHADQVGGREHRRRLHPAINAVSHLGDERTNASPPEKGCARLLALQPPG